MNHSHHHDHGSMASMGNVHQMMGHTAESTNGHPGKMGDMMMMAMTFHGGYQETILFDQWSTHSVGAFVASWFAVFLFSIAYEALKTFRDYLARREFTARRNSLSTPSGVNADDPNSERANDSALIPSNQNENRRQNRARLLSLPHLIQTFLHIIQMGISYLLMLIAMTYNGYLFLAVVLGAGCGHFLFAWSRSNMMDFGDHCH